MIRTQQTRTWLEWAVLLTVVGALWLSTTSWAIAGGCEPWCLDERRAATQALQDDLIFLWTRQSSPSSSSWALTDALMQVEKLQRLDREAEAKRRHDAEMELIYRAFEGRSKEGAWPTK